LTAPVLKTGKVKAFVGSNPTLSAIATDDLIHWIRNGIHARTHTRIEESARRERVCLRPGQGEDESMSNQFGNHARLFAFALLCAVVASCATSPTGRRQLLLIPEAEMAAMGRSAFVEMQGEIPKSTNSAQTAYVRCVANSIVAVLGPSDLRGIVVDDWQVELFQDETANAFALPGGRIGVHTGLLQVATTPSQLAAVLGHEVGHVTARHGNARVSSSQLAQSGMDLASIFFEGSDPATKQEMMGLLGMGVQMGILMPYGRGDESEADQIGLELMARAGFDPREAVTLWQNMGRAAGGQAPPEFMSTHPSHATRIRQLQAHMETALPLYEKAQAEGRRPNCR
jgi:predicted Zn-dependent protease